MRKQFIRPLPTVEVEVESARSKGEISGGDARQPKRDPVGHLQDLSRSPECVVPVILHPGEFAERENRLDLQSRDLEHSVGTGSRTQRPHGIPRAPIEPGNRGSQRAALIIDEDAALPDAGDRNAGDGAAGKLTGGFRKAGGRRREQRFGIVFALSTAEVSDGRRTARLCHLVAARIESEGSDGLTADVDTDQEGWFEAVFHSGIPQFEMDHRPWSIDEAATTEAAGTDGG